MRLQWHYLQKGDHSWKKGYKIQMFFQIWNGCWDARYHKKTGDWVLTGDCVNVLDVHKTLESLENSVIKYIGYKRHATYMKYTEAMRTLEKTDGLIMSLRNPWPVNLFTEQKPSAR